MELFDKLPIDIQENILRHIYEKERKDNIKLVNFTIKVLNYKYIETYQENQELHSSFPNFLQMIIQPKIKRVSGLFNGLMYDIEDNTIFVMYKA